tara:strand:+ start:632 stop:859 length:228 start_codon:yes stop_codon:yes gene_type:complete
MFNYKKLFLLIFLSSLSMVTQAHAYFDPGTGSLIIQTIIALFATAFVTVSMMWTKFKNFLSRIFKKKQKKTKKND